MTRDVRGPRGFFSNAAGPYLPLQCCPRCTSMDRWLPQTFRSTGGCQAAAHAQRAAAARRMLMPHPKDTSNCAYHRSKLISITYAPISRGKHDSHAARRNFKAGCRAAAYMHVQYACLRRDQPPIAVRLTLASSYVDSGWIRDTRHSNGIHRRSKLERKRHDQDDRGNVDDI